MSTDGRWNQGGRRDGVGSRKWKSLGSSLGPQLAASLTLPLPEPQLPPPEWGEVVGGRGGSEHPSRDGETEAPRAPGRGWFPALPRAPAPPLPSASPGPPPPAHSASLRLPQSLCPSLCLSPSACLSISVSFSAPCLSICFPPLLLCLSVFQSVSATSV